MDPGSKPTVGTLRPTTVVVPVFDDWAAASLLLSALDDAFLPTACRPSILFVDDGSTEAPRLNPPRPLRALQAVDILPLARNLGHQRAIALGLAWVEANRPGSDVVVMDGDGEDAPADALKLLEKARENEGQRVVFAQRTHRQEGLVFRTAYVLYKGLFRLATGTGISFGNFSVVPWSALQRLTRVSEVWNNYAAAILKSRVPYVLVPTPKAPRLTGQSKMNFTSLVLHGLSALAVYSDTVAVRAVLAASALVAAMSAAIVTVVGVRLGTDLAIPGWASSSTGLAVTILLQGVLLSSQFAFLVLGSRNAAGFLPSRDHTAFTLPLQRVHPSGADPG